jgi:Uma2 family endonuclease
VSVAPSTSGLTWEDFLNLPADDRYKHAELVDGALVHKYPALVDAELTLLNPPTRRHQRVILRLAFAIETWIRADPARGELAMEPTVQVRSNRGYLPDLAWFSADRVPRDAGDPYPRVAPDLAVEVLSPSTRSFDLLRKRVDYARIGVRELWLIDPDMAAALVLRLPTEPPQPAEFVQVEELDADGVLSSPLLPGLEIPVRELLP